MARFGRRIPIPLAYKRASNSVVGNKVVALLHADGTDGSSTFVDSSPLSANWTAVNGAVVSSAQSKFGGSSIAFPNSNSYIQSSAAYSNFAFGTGDFTVEMWVYTISLPVGGATDIGFANPDIQWFISSNGALAWDIDNVQKINSGPSVITTGAWQHIAVSRSGGSTRMFVDGAQKGSTSADSTIYAATSQFVVGKTGAPTTHWNGYVDEIRITKGYAWYTSNFTPSATQLGTVAVIDNTTPATQKFYKESSALTPSTVSVVRGRLF